ncbi:hypothetical protein ACG2LH_07660 [Zhouia sp. PK063]|uniref:hypothetical protein n=1 Tax=Zhouia sp. PK063 TaxID=3373602 RepID=UPI0037BAB4B8
MNVKKLIFAILAIGLLASSCSPSATADEDALYTPIKQGVDKTQIKIPAAG